VFHRGEVAGYQDQAGEWHRVTVVTGACDQPPPGVLAVLRRQSDGQRLILRCDPFELVEQAEGRSERFDWRQDREPVSQFDDAAGRGGGAPARRAMHVGGRTLREPTVGD
jgi:hypothetical protein